MAVIIKVAFVFLLAVCSASQNVPSSQNKKHRSTKSEELNSKAKAIVQQEISRKNTASYYCIQQGKYLDYSGTCKDCLDLCQNGDLGMCKQKCPTTYVKVYELEPLAQRIERLNSATAALQTKLYITCVVIAIGVVALLLWTCCRLRICCQQIMKDQPEANMETKVQQFPVSNSSSVCSLTNGDVDTQWVSSRQEVVVIEETEGDENQRYPIQNTESPFSNIPPTEDESNETHVKA